MQIRAAESGDADAIARVHVDAWRAAYRRIIDDAYLDGLSAERRAAAWRASLERGPPPETLVAVHEHACAGWICHDRSRDADDAARAGEIWAIYVSPERWRGGIGRALVQHAERALAARGLHACTVWVLERNDPAIAFYRAQGFGAEPDARREHPVGRQNLVEIRLRKALGACEAVPAA